MIETLGWYIWLFLSWLRRDEYDGPDGSIECPTCNGNGWASTETEEFDKDVPMMIELCPTCAGTGWYYIPTHQEMG